MLSMALGGVLRRTAGSCGGVVLVKLWLNESSRSLVLSLSFSTKRKLCNEESEDEREDAPDGPDDPLLADELK